ncbi:Annexin [Xylaria sp. CBS 124048]|nr:Annexin [Xylaria sp. CBS 124048]
MSYRTSLDRGGPERSPSTRRDGYSRDDTRRVSESPSYMHTVRMPSPPAGFRYDDPRRPPPFDYSHDGVPPPRRDPYRLNSPPQQSRYYSRSSEGVDMPMVPESGARYSTPTIQEPRQSKGDIDVVEAVQDTLRRGANAFLPAKYIAKLQTSDSESEERKMKKKSRMPRNEDDDLAYGSASSLVDSETKIRTKTKTKTKKYESTHTEYSIPGQWTHDQPDDKSMSSDRMLSISSERVPSRNSFGAPDRRASGSKLLANRSVNSPKSATARLSALSINTSHHSTSLSYASASGLAPASPLLESYHGTYQESSPMPSPILLAAPSPRNSTINALEPLSPGVSDNDSGEKKTRRRARFYDPEEDAERLSRALKGEYRSPRTETLIEVLPGLSHEQVMELRSQYKKLVKVGPDKRGVNIAKHIRLRLKDEDPLLMKACYATALGKWESDAYWANFWYQGDKTRRELLIESLIGRTNEEIRRIKDAFSDKKYGDSLVQCMKTELKEDKFKKAVLLVLDERRMEDRDGYGRLLPIDRRLVEDDVEALYNAVHAERGGESAMIHIVLLRSDEHLREVLKSYEKGCRSNFARDALRKSGNLVGELLAHILNGIVNKPVRDALLLHHALNASRKDNLRRELLISRLVRFHWDRQHFAAIKNAYIERYREDLLDAVREGTSGEWGHFCEQLAVTRMPDDVKRFDAVESLAVEKRDEQQHLRERERELDREYERQKEKRDEYHHERPMKERESGRIREKEKEKDRGRHHHHTHSTHRNEGMLVVRDSKHREYSRSRERSRRRD